MSKNILIYESGAYGHRFEYIEYLVEFLAKYDVHDNIFFIINSEIYNKIGYLIKLFEANGKVNFTSIPDEIQDKIDKEDRIFKKAIIEKLFLERCFTNLSIDKVIFLELDRFQFVIGAWRFSKFSKILISGILFLPYLQEPTSSFQIFIKKIRKRLQLHWLTLYPNLEAIFILNDEDTVLKSNNLLGITNKFKYLADPIKMKEFNKIDYRKLFGIEEDKKILLSIGTIQRRKNIINILKSIELLDGGVASRICLLIIGTTNDEVLLAEINNKINEIKQTQIIFVNKFAYEDDLESAFVDADAVFVTYNNFFASSNIIGHAAKHHKFIISSNQGVLNSITKKYNLGVVVDPNNISEIKEAITDYVLGNVRFHPNDDFVKYHQAENYSETLLGYNQF